ncbi:DUF4156 domain-containing protein [Pandoraea commovens]|uniref:Lipoprotein n=1 Tax=Pandoraea commovens TaxID=2508289 RepID=A0A5E4VGD9_9BURK|nr:DUF4156 domain-containing protein [Pandoraea commovens]VVE10030.1 hypothetical protein PCO31010_02600 [Pandoraea commovens]
MTRGKGFIHFFAAGMMVASIAGCTTTLTPAGTKIAIATAAQKEKCQSLGIVVGTQKTGFDKTASAMNAALNLTAARGGNSLYVISTSTDWAEGSSVTGEALRCAHM